MYFSTADVVSGSRADVGSRIRGGNRNRSFDAGAIKSQPGSAQKERFQTTSKKSSVGSDDDDDDDDGTQLEGGMGKMKRE